MKRNILTLIIFWILLLIGLFFASWFPYFYGYHLTSWVGAFCIPFVDVFGIFIVLCTIYSDRKEWNIKGLQYFSSLVVLFILAVISLGGAYFTTIGSTSSNVTRKTAIVHNIYKLTDITGNEIETDPGHKVGDKLYKFCYSKFNGDRVCTDWGNNYFKTNWMK